jgi:hypothetical protein
MRLPLVCPGDLFSYDATSEKMLFLVISVTKYVSPPRNIPVEGWSRADLIRICRGGLLSFTHTYFADERGMDHLTKV